MRRGPRPARAGAGHSPSSGRRASRPRSRRAARTARRGCRRSTRPRPRQRRPRSPRPRRPRAAPAKSAIAPKPSASRTALSVAAARWAGRHAHVPRPRADDERDQEDGAQQEQLGGQRAELLDHEPAARDGCRQEEVERAALLLAGHRGGSRGNGRDDQEERDHEREELDPEVAGARRVVELPAEADHALQRVGVGLEQLVEARVVADRWIDGAIIADEPRQPEAPPEDPAPRVAEGLRRRRYAASAPRRGRGRRRRPRGRLRGCPARARGSRASAFTSGSAAPRSEKTTVAPRRSSSRTPGTPGERAGRRRLRERRLDPRRGSLAQRLDLVDEHEPPFADQRDPVATCCTSESTCDERKTGRPARRRLRTSSWNTCCTSGSRPDVGSSRTSSSGWCMNAWTSPTFCRLPFESAWIGRSSSSPSRSASSLPLAEVAEAAQTSEIAEELPRRQSVVEPQVARARSRAAGGSRRRPGASRARRSRAARRRADQVEHQPDRRRLPGTVRPEEAEDLAGPTSNVSSRTPVRRP